MDKIQLFDSEFLAENLKIPLVDLDNYVARTIGGLYKEITPDDLTALMDRILDATDGSTCRTYKIKNASLAVRNRAANRRGDVGNDLLTAKDAAEEELYITYSLAAFALGYAIGKGL